MDHFFVLLVDYMLRPFSSVCSLNHWKSVDECRDPAEIYKILYDHVAVPASTVDLILSSRPSRGIDANSQKLVTVRSFTENYRQSYSIRTVRDWNARPQSVVSAGSSAQFKSHLTCHVAIGVQLVGAMLQLGALPTNCPDPDPDYLNVNLL